jgi:hypothetical protein
MPVPPDPELDCWIFHGESSMRCLACGSKIYNHERRCKRCRHDTRPAQEALDVCLLLLFAGAWFSYLVHHRLIVWSGLLVAGVCAFLFTLRKRRQTLHTQGRRDEQATPGPAGRPDMARSERQGRLRLVVSGHEQAHAPSPSEEGAARSDRAGSRS